LVVSSIDYQGFFKNLLNLTYYHILGALFFLILQSFVVSKRWMVIISKLSKPISYRKILRTHYLSLSSSLVLPNLVAEPAVKAYLLKKQNVPISDVITSVVMDKLFVLIGLASLSIATFPSILLLYSDTMKWFYPYIIVLSGLPLIAYLVRSKSVKSHINRNRFFKRIPEKYLDAAKYMVFDKKISLPCLALSFASQGLAICSVFILSLPMEPSLTFYQCILLMPPVMLLTAMPIAFNGWGVRELAMIYVLGFANITAEAALALSVQFGTIGLLLWSMGLLFWIPTGRNHEDT
jgi:glycosyltransferase 2 family protein